MSKLFNWWLHCSVGVLIFKKELKINKYVYEQSGNKSMSFCLLSLTYIAAPTVAESHQLNTSTAAH